MAKQELREKKHTFKEFLEYIKEQGFELRRISKVREPTSGTSSEDTEERSCHCGSKMFKDGLWWRCPVCRIYTKEGEKSTPVTGQGNIVTEKELKEAEDWYYDVGGKDCPVCGGRLVGKRGLFCRVTLGCSKCSWSDEALAENSPYEPPEDAPPRGKECPDGGERECNLCYYFNSREGCSLEDTPQLDSAEGKELVFYHHPNSNNSMIERWKCEVCGVWNGCAVRQLKGEKPPRFCPRYGGEEAKWEIRNPPEDHPPQGEECSYYFNPGEHRCCLAPNHKGPHVCECGKHSEDTPQLDSAEGKDWKAEYYALRKRIVDEIQFYQETTNEFNKEVSHFVQMGFRKVLQDSPEPPSTDEQVSKEEKESE